MENITLNELEKLVAKSEKSRVLSSISSGEKPELDRIFHLDNDLYEYLPEVLNNMVGKTTNRIKRDMRLIGLLVIVSGVLPNIIGEYDNNNVHPNLNLFLSGPFASGKGELNSLKIWVDRINKHLEKIYKDEMSQYRSDLKEGKEDLEKPIRQWLFIPADNSKSGFIELFSQSNGRGILMDTEADTLTSTFSLEFGNYSDILRKVYHHETVSFYRRTNKEKIDIENPCLSVILGGTTDQFEKMFFNSSNGLLSRFIIYNVRPIQVFKNVFSEEKINFDSSTITAYRQWILDNYLRLEKLSKPVSFSLTDRQKDIFVKYFSNQKKVVAETFNDEDAGFVNRMALNVFKIMMILSAVRSFEKEVLPAQYICSDNDFFVGIQLYEMLREHFFYSYYNLLMGKDKVYRNHKELKPRITSLKQQGYSFRKIQDILGIPFSTVHRIYKGY